MSELAIEAAASSSLSALLDGTNYRAIARLGSGSMGVHRDIKPDNLFLCERGPDREQRLKILDFGIVKIAAPSRDHGPSPLAFPTTKGTAIGTPRFFAPEQAQGRAVDSRADLYAAGCVLFWLLTGRDPFQRRLGMFSLLHAHVNEPPAPPSAVARQPISPALDRLMLRALAIALLTVALVAVAVFLYTSLWGGPS